MEVIIGLFWNVVAYLPWAEKISGWLLSLAGSWKSRPKLLVEYFKGGGESGAGTTGDKLMIGWEYRVRITNLTREDATELEVLHTNLPQLSKLGVHHLRALDILNFNFKLSRELDRSFVLTEPRHDFHGRLEPEELKNLSMLLKYKDRWGVSCYTDYHRGRASGENLWTFRKPKLQK